MVPSPARIMEVRVERDRLRAALERLVCDQVCAFDPLNPCFNNRPTDVVGRHWGGSPACAVCNARGVLRAVPK